MYIEDTKLCTFFEKFYEYTKLCKLNIKNCEHSLIS